MRKLAWFTALLVGCGAETIGGGPDMTPASSSLTFGRDVDEAMVRELTSNYALPKELMAALNELSIAPASLTFPDIGVTYAREPARLRWTDTLRHEGLIGPTFGHRLAADVEAALAAPADEVVRELLVAQSSVNQRESLTATRFDKAVIVAASTDGLVAALQSYHAHARVEGDPAEALAPWSTVEPALRAVVERIPGPAQAALAQCIAGLITAAELRDRALTGSTMDIAEWSEYAATFLSTWETTDGLTAARNASKAVDFALLARAGQIAVRSVESLRVALAGAAPVAGARLELAGPLGRIAIALDAADDSWSGGDFFLLVDGAGNDTYLDDTAANLDFFHPVTAVLDLAGNDTYKPSFDWDIDVDKALPGPIGDPTARQAAGHFGVAVLDDASGDDSYLCPRHCQGSALFGVGVMIDRDGNDRYRGYDASQGSSEFGYGLLVDTGRGKDRYVTWKTSQGYGGTRGIGWLVDDGGDDEYLAIEDPIIEDWANEQTNWSGSQGFGFGHRALPSGPYLSGGLGALFDLDGDDSYQCAVMCQGFGYFFGTGLLYDKRGNDRYVVTHKYGIGGATHQSVGLFLDGGGADTYDYPGHGRTAGGEGVGLGYDHGVAYHIDRGPEADRYSFPLDIGWVLGFARHPALGVLINEGGDDTYSVRGAAGRRALGWSEGFAGDRNAQLGSTNTPALGVFLDLGGRDTYDAMHDGTGNKMKWIQKTPEGDGWDPKLDHGYGLDTE